MWAEDDGKNLLVLCPFSPEYSERYEKLLPIIRGYSNDKSPRRMLDLRSPRLVGQALYEQIRWSSHCIVDWTEWSPNVFFELGVRLACSERDPVCFIGRIDLDKRLTDARAVAQPLEQYAMLQALFEPVLYDENSPYEAFEKALESFRETLDPGRSESRHAKGGVPSWRVLPPGGTFAVAQASFQWRHDDMLTRPDIEQRERAEQILGKDQERTPEPLVLFAKNVQFDSELRAAVREKWIAAWLYLRHLNTSAGAGRDDIRTKLMVVSRMVEQALGSSDDARHRSLREEIAQLVETQRAERGPRENFDDHG